MLNIQFQTEVILINEAETQTEGVELSIQFKAIYVIVVALRLEIKFQAQKLY